MRPNHSCVKPRFGQSAYPISYIIGDEGEFWRNSFWDCHCLRSSEIPFANGAIFADWKKDILVSRRAKPKSRNALSVPLQIGAFFYLANIPHFQETVVSTWNHSVRKGREFGHPNAWFVPAYHIGFIICIHIKFVELSDLYLPLINYYCQIIGAGCYGLLVGRPIQAEDRFRMELRNLAHRLQLHRLTRIQ